MILQFFKIFDKNQDGFIDKFELRDVLTRLGENITDVSLQFIFKYTLSFNSFIVY